MRCASRCACQARWEAWHHFQHQLKSVNRDSKTHRSSDEEWKCCTSPGCQTHTHTSFVARSRRNEAEAKSTSAVSALFCFACRTHSLPFCRPADDFSPLSLSLFDTMSCKVYLEDKPPTRTPNRERQREKQRERESERERESKSFNLGLCSR